MAVNLIGQSVQLLLNQAQGADIGKGLLPGDVVQARLVDILPDNRAIIQLKGLNLLATLPPAQTGQSFAKGALLDLIVLKSNVMPASPPSEAVQASSQQKVSPQQAPALSLKLVGINMGINTRATPPSVALEIATQSAVAQPNFEAALTLAKVPVNSSNLQAAQSLSRHGLPLDRATINSVVQAADSMIETENSLTATSASQPSPPIQSLAPILVQVKSALLAAVRQTGQTQPGNQLSDHPSAQELLVKVDELLANQPAPTAQPTQDIAMARQGLETAVAMLAKAEPNALPRLRAALGQITEALQANQGDSKSGSQHEPLNAVATSSAAPPKYLLSPALDAAFKRELLAAVLPDLTRAASMDTPLKQQDILVHFDQVRLQILQPELRVSEKVLQSAKLQVPEVASMETIPDAQAPLLKALSEMKDAFVRQPIQVPLKSETAVQRAFESRGLGRPPQISLDSLPRGTVLEAVAFLKARGLPTSRPLVETVAAELNNGSDLAAGIQDIAMLEPQLPQGTLLMHPELKQAFDALNQFMSDHGVKPEMKDVWAQIQNFVGRSGMNLEKTLGQPPAQPGPAASPGNPVHPPEESLKALLLKFSEVVERASGQPLAQASAEVASKLDHLNGQINGVLNSMHALTLSARPTPAFDVSTVQLPVFIGGQMQSGQLSIYWKRGRPHELSANDPVNVVFMLNTRGLGEVKVQLQVWKSECQCKVTVSNDATRDFIRVEAKDLKTSFERNTRFKLNSIDVSTQDAFGRALTLGLNQLPGTLEGPGPRNAAASLNLTA